MNDETQICPTCLQRLDPGDGYRLLSVGEIRTSGDECYRRGKWLLIPNLWFSRPLKTNSDPTRRAVSTAIDPGEGYRLLTVGERRKVDDEFFVPGRGWKIIRPAYASVPLKTNSRPTRRKMVMVAVPPYPGNGYRLLSLGELFRPGDEVLSDSQVWLTLIRSGVGAHMRPDSRPTRRKIESPVLPAQVCPGFGYRLLAPNEILEVGDELFSTFANQWEKFFPQTVGMPLCFGITARRKILPDPGAGYRWLKVGETIQESDEAFIGGKYETYLFDHGKIFDGVEYFIPRRRKIEIPVPVLPDPGAGYRLLKVGEVRKRGDEYWVNGKWNGPTSDVGHPVFKYSWPYRRKVSPKHYRLLVVGEMIVPTDEVWSGPMGSSLGFWQTLNKHSVLTSAYSPIRREIDSYIGGPA